MSPAMAAIMSAVIEARPNGLMSPSTTRVAIADTASVRTGSITALIDAMTGAVGVEAGDIANSAIVAHVVRP